jgi:hypothetical protein
MPPDEETWKMVSQTISARKSLLAVFFNPNHILIMDLLPQRTGVTAAEFMMYVVVPLAN